MGVTGPCAVKPWHGFGTRMGLIDSIWMPLVSSAALEKNRKRVRVVGNSKERTQRGMDGSDSGLPATEFARVWRGYDPDEVDAFRQQAEEHAQKLEVQLAAVTRQTDEYSGEIERLKQRLENANPGEQSLDGILADDRRTREQMLAEARGRMTAELEEHHSEIQREESAATERASEIVTAAQSQASELRGIAERDVAQVRHDATQEADRIVGNTKATVEAQMAEADRKVGEAERKATSLTEEANREATATRAAADEYSERKRTEADADRDEAEKQLADARRAAEKMRAAAEAKVASIIVRGEQEAAATRNVAEQAAAKIREESNAEKAQLDAEISQRRTDLNALQGTIADIEARLNRFNSMASEEMKMLKGLSAAIGDTGMDALRTAEADRQAKAAAKAAYQAEAAPVAAPAAEPGAAPSGVETTGTDIQSTGTVHVMLEEDNYYERRAGMQSRIQEAQDAGEHETDVVPEFAAGSPDSAQSVDSPDAAEGSADSNDEH